MLYDVFSRPRLYENKFTVGKSKEMIFTVGRWGGGGLDTLGCDRE